MHYRGHIGHSGWEHQHGHHGDSGHFPPQMGHGSQMGRGGFGGALPDGHGPHGFVPPFGGPHGGHMALPLDADKNGKISKDEVLKQFAKVDTNGDGNISPEELASHLHNLHQQHAAPAGTGGNEGHGRSGQGSGGSGSSSGPPGRGPQGRRGFEGPPSAAGMFHAMDRNNDGKLSKDEVPGPMWSRLSEADADKDGFISRAELEEFWKQHRPNRPPGAEPQKPAGRPTGGRAT